MGVLEYSANNSGGSWWLKHSDWEAMEQAGWIVHWVHDIDDPSHVHPPEDSAWPSIGEHTHSYDKEHLLTPVKWNGQGWLGASAKSAAIETEDPDATIREWERVANQNAEDEGCNCCGQPHYFTFTSDDGKRASLDVEIVETRRSWS